MKSMLLTEQPRRVSSCSDYTKFSPHEALVRCFRAVGAPWSEGAFPVDTSKIRYEGIDNSELLPGRPKARWRISRVVHRLYERFIVSRIPDPLIRQRLKLGWLGWGYWGLLFLKAFSLHDRIRLIWRFLTIDWHVLHGHWPSEITLVSRALADRVRREDEAVVEAGCWHGGSSAKFSILCKMLGYRLHIYDSFEGVGDLTDEDRANEWDYEGQYASPESVLHENLRRYGEESICSIYKGWFSNTLARGMTPARVKLSYIDCDIAKGTRDALDGIVPSLVSDGWIFSQDFHIEPVRRLLCEEASWQKLDKGMPTIVPLGWRLASIRFTNA